MKKAADKFVNAGVEIKHVDLGGGFRAKYKEGDPNFEIRDVKRN